MHKKEEVGWSGQSISRRVTSTKGEVLITAKTICQEVIIWNNDLDWCKITKSIYSVIKNLGVYSALPWRAKSSIVRTEFRSEVKPRLLCNPYVLSPEKSEKLL